MDDALKASFSNTAKEKRVAGLSLPVSMPQTSQLYPRHFRKIFLSPGLQRWTCINIPHPGTRRLPVLILKTIFPTCNSHKGHTSARLIRTTPSSAVQAPPWTSAKGSCEMMPSDSRPCSAPLLLLSPPSLSPTALPTPGTASAGTGVGNWKGELQSTKAYQQAARESSAAVFGGPARGPERVGSLLFGGTGRTRMAALLRTGTAAVEAGRSSLRFLLGLPRPRRAAREQESGTARRSGRPRLPAVLGVALGTASWPLKCHQVPSLHRQK